MPGFTPLSHELVAFWHPTKNNVAPSAVSNGSGKDFWWRCLEGHEWQTRPLNLRRNPCCPVCSGRKLLSGVNDIQTTHSHLAAQWHPTRNLLKPNEVTASYSKHVWWMCSQQHEWKALVNYRAREGSGCPYCTGQRSTPGITDLSSTHPLLTAELHPEKNPLGCTDLMAGSTRSVWWLGLCGHEWKASPQSRIRGTGCPYCANQKVLAGFNDLATTHPHLVDEWHPELNDDHTPENIISGSNKRVWWQCQLGHKWRVAPGSRIRKDQKLSGCPVCTNRVVMPGFNDMASAHPILAQEWAENNIVGPDQVTVHSGIVVSWVCTPHQHVWKTTVANRTRGGGCPYCANQKVLAGFNDLATTHPHLVDEWHPTKNEHLSPEHVVPGYGRAVWWQCFKQHEWTAAPKDRTRTDSKGASGCPQCVASRQVSREEENLAALLRELFPTNTVQTSSRSVIKGELDIYIPSKKFAIEFNGLYWHSERFKERDFHYKKWQACKEKGIQLIQVWEDEWNRNPEQVKRMLAHKLGIQLPGERRVMARKTQVAVLSKQQAETFLNEHHVQGYAAGSYYLGLTESGDIDSLVAVLVLKKEAGTEGKTLNIIRYATAATVPGGFTKLLKHAERTFAPDSFITFSDHCVSDGGLYKNNGFIADKELPPDYMYVVRNERKHKFGYRLKRFREDPNLKYEDGLTEKELAQLNGLPRIWDAGKTRWVKSYS